MESDQSKVIHSAHQLCNLIPTVTLKAAKVMNSIQPSMTKTSGVDFHEPSRALLTCLPTWLPGAACLPEQEVEYDCRRWRWWWWGGSPRVRAPWRRRRQERWEHDLITGLCNRSEPRSALCNGIRSARCSQLEHQCHRDAKQCGSNRNFTHTVGMREKVAAGVNIPKSWVNSINS